MATFYSYLYFDTRPEKNLEPIYAGKGTGGRYKDHLRVCSNILLKGKIRKMRMLGLEPKIEIHPAESEDHAKQMEIALIAKYGRIDNGTGKLCNFTDGGEGTSGYRHSENALAKQKASLAIAMPRILQKRAITNASSETKAKRAANKINPEIIANRKASWEATRAKRMEVNKDPAVIERKRLANVIAQNKQEVKDKIFNARAEKRRIKYPDWANEKHLAFDQALREGKIMTTWLRRYDKLNTQKEMN